MAIESKMNRGPIGGSSQRTQAKRPRSWTWITIGIIILVLIGGWYAFSSDSAVGGTVNISSGQYQAVFLDNGQVYFGELDRDRSLFYTLSDVFYLQSGSTIESASNLALTKLGNEAHGPTDKMEINADHILFIEDMKDDSKVVQAIKDYKSKN
jgi:hypothetical protein